MDQPRNRPAPNTMNDIILQSCGLRWHGPDPRSAWVPPVVGAPSRSEGYGVLAPPRIWRGTRRRWVGIRNAAHQTCAEVP